MLRNIRIAGVAKGRGAHKGKSWPERQEKVHEDFKEEGIVNGSETAEGGQLDLNSFPFHPGVFKPLLGDVTVVISRLLVLHTRSYTHSPHHHLFNCPVSHSGEPSGLRPQPKTSSSSPTMTYVSQHDSPEGLPVARGRGGASFIHPLS